MRKNILFILLVTIVGCKKILNPSQTGEIPLSSLFTNESGAVSAIFGCYQPLLSLNNGTSSFYSIFSVADDDGWQWNPNNQPDIYTVDPSDARILDIWTTLYAGITRCNSVIENAPNAKYVTNNMESAIIGQAYFLRAYYYFHLVRIFGKVPLITNEVKTRNDASQPRTSIQSVYDTIKNDLSLAKNLLPENYNNGPGVLAPGLATKYAAFALSAMVNLELQEWADAVDDATTVIESNHYSLLSNFADNFNGKAENGSESIFEEQFGAGIAASSSTFSATMAPAMYNGGNASGGVPLATDINYSNYPGYKNTGQTGAFGDGIVQAFEPNDLRFDITLKSYGITNFLDPTQPNGSLLYVDKFIDIQNPPNLSNHNFPLVRLAEIYLIRAEALNEISPNNNMAVSDVDKVRERAGLTDLRQSVYSNQQAFREAIRKERRVELCFEGKRYFDLNRWGALRSTLALQSTSVPVSRTIAHPISNVEYFLYPIPQTEFVNNPKLQGDQNPGY